MDSEFCRLYKICIAARIIDLFPKIFVEVVGCAVDSLSTLLLIPSFLVILTLKRLRQVNIITYHKKQARGPPHLLPLIYT